MHAMLLVHDASDLCPGRVVLSSSLLVTPPGGAGHIESGAGGADREKP